MDEPDIQRTIDEAMAELGKVSSENELTKIGWLVFGLDLWHQTEGKFGHSKEDATRYVISSVAHLLARHRDEAAREAEERTRKLYIKELKYYKDLSELLLQKDALKTEPRPIVVEVNPKSHTYLTDRGVNDEGAARQLGQIS